MSGGVGDHKCVDPVVPLGAGFCCRCLQAGPKRETVEEMEADCVVHRQIECWSMIGDDVPDGPAFLPGETPQRYGNPRRLKADSPQTEQSGQDAAESDQSGDQG